jgi:hypothetical protein
VAAQTCKGKRLAIQPLQIQMQGQMVVVVQAPQIQVAAEMDL